jgi:hypothetical protein
MEASMELKGRMSQTFLNVSFLALDFSLILYLGFPSASGSLHSRRPVLADPFPITQASETNALSSVHFEGSLVFPVVQQPDGKPNFVSKNAGEITQFSSASDYGNIGLLAHNYLSGKSFFRLVVGEEIHLAYQDGATETFVVSEILKYEALDSKSPFSSFRNLSDQDEVLSVQQMFARAYGGERHITFQTCIAKYGNASWGRLFVLAVPKVETLGIVR